MASCYRPHDVQHNDTQHKCCKYFIFSIMSFFRYQSRSVESCPDVSQRCNGCPLHQRLLSFAYDLLRCKIRLQKARKSCVCEFATPDKRLMYKPSLLLSHMLTHSILANLLLTKLDCLSTLDLLSQLYRTSIKLSSG
jgi:hypothetical protein